MYGCLLACVLLWLVPKYSGSARDTRCFMRHLPVTGSPQLQVVSGILALLVAALTLFPDRQLPIMAVLLVLLIEVRGPLLCQGK